MDFDAEKIQQIITNLLSNAVKFIPKGGHVYITLASREDESTKIPQLIIKVRDTGGRPFTDIRGTGGSFH